MLKRLLFLLKNILLTMLIFVTAKMVFMLYNQPTHSFAAADALDVATHGLTLDLSTAIYVLIIPYLYAVVSAFWSSSKRLAMVLKGYYVLIAVAFALGFVADTSLYEFWQYKLDATCLQYLDTPTEAMASVSVGYLLLRLAVLLVVPGVIYKAYAATISQAPPASALRHRLTEGLCYLLLIPLMVVGIRGGIDESTTNVGQVYYSQNQFLNHAAVNPIFNFMASFEKTATENTVYSFYSEKEVMQLTDGLYSSESTASDTLLTTDRPNLVVILLESCGKMFMNVMPNLQKAAAEGVDFTNCYGNSYRTDRGTVCALSGYLSFPTMSVMKMSNKVSRLPGIARSLQREGYTTEYLYGGDINFTKMKGYLISTGFQQLRWKQDYTQQEQNTSKWGVRDDITFKTLSQMILSHDGGQPFLIGYSTLSSHEPWDVPVSKYKDEQLNAFYYLDQCIGTFLSDMKRSKQWDNLLIVLMPDHSIDYRDMTQQTPDRNRIPMIWTGGAVKKPRRMDMLCNQSDFAATLLGQMHIGHADYRFSRDVTSKDYRYPFAIHMFNNGISMTDSTGFMLYDLTSERITVETSPDAKRMAHTAKAILQLASEDLSNK